MNKKLRIIYMGTPDFAVEPLRVMLEAGYNIQAVITAPDKPAGRGQKLSISPVKEFAVSNNLKVLQPVNLKDPDFIEQLRNLDANLQVVVAFRMLPEVVWNMPEFGTLNLHASLLPQYRGAAPINHAIINGETETGVTTFFIEHEIDTGKIILSHKQPILPSDDAGILHDRLMFAGGVLVLETLKLIETGDVKAKSQTALIPNTLALNTAPKIFKNYCKINWDSTCENIHNHIRGLSPFPGAFSTLITENETPKQLKIFKTSFEIKATSLTPGSIITDNKKNISVATKDGVIHIEELQLEGKKRMKTSDFLLGISILPYFKFI